MYEQHSCTNNYPNSGKAYTNSENMDPHECEGEEKFTKFSISEIMKPDFGRRDLTTGVLNLSRDKNTYEQADSLASVFNWSSHPLHQFGLKFGAYINSKCANSKQTIDISRGSHTTETEVRHIAPHKFSHGLNLDVRSSLLSQTQTITDKSGKHNIHTVDHRRRESCGGSDGESVKSSPATSPAGSPGSSPTGPTAGKSEGQDGKLWPAWVYCTRYSDRPSAGPRSRKIKRKEKTVDEKRPRTAFTSDQLRKLKEEFETNKYLTESRRLQLAGELDLNESQIKIWFQNKRAKIKKTSGERNTLAMELLAQGLYNHKTSSDQVKMET